MSVVAAHLYRNGKKAKAVSLDEPIDCKGKSEFVWIGLFEPTETELQQLEKNYGLHPLAIEDALKADQIPKVDVYDDQLFVIARTAHLEHDHIAYGETAIFVGQNLIIIGPARLGTGTYRAPRAARSGARAAGPWPGLRSPRHPRLHRRRLSPDCRDDRGTCSGDGAKRARQFPRPHRGQADLRATSGTDPVQADDRPDDGGRRPARPPRYAVSRCQRAPLFPGRPRPCPARRRHGGLAAGRPDFGFRGQQPAGAAASGRDHAPAGRVGRDTGGADRDRRDLRHELRKHARVEDRNTAISSSSASSRLCTVLYVRFKRARWL